MIADGLHVSLLVHIEVRVDAVAGGDIGEQRRGRAGLHQIAYREFGATDAAGDRRLHIGMIQIEFGLRELRLRRLDRRFRNTRRIHALIIIGAGDSLHANQCFRARQIGARKRGIRFRRRQIGFGLRHCGFIRARIDDEENVASLHLLPILEPDLGDAAVHFRAHIGGIDRRHAAGELRPDADGLGMDRGDLDRNRRLCRVGRGRAGGGMPGGEADAAQQDQSRQAQKRTVFQGLEATQRGASGEKFLGLHQLGNMGHRVFPSNSVSNDTDIGAGLRPSRPLCIIRYNKKGMPDEDGSAQRILHRDRARSRDDGFLAERL